MRFRGSAVVVAGDNIDTDVLYPGSYLNIDNPDEMKPHLFEGLDPQLRDELSEGCVLVVGSNFGTGSSREHVPHALKAWGVGCVLGKSFARIFYRNCINLGLPVVQCADAAAAAKEGSSIRIDTEAGVVEVDGASFEAPVVPGFMEDMLASGGLVEWVRARLQEPVSRG